MLAPGGVRMRELVDDAHLRLSREDGVDVHFLQHDAAVFDLALGNDLEIADLRVGLRASVGFDEADDNVDALAPEGMGILEHRVGLANARGSANIDTQPRALGSLNPRQHLIACWPRELDHLVIVRASLNRAQCSYDFFTA